MQVPNQFERLSTWLKGQFRSVERVSTEQGSATYLVSTAEYELGRLRRELAGLALDPTTGIARLKDIDTLAAAPYRDEGTHRKEREAAPTPNRQTEHTEQTGPKNPIPLMARLRDPSSNAA